MPNFKQTTAQQSSGMSYRTNNWLLEDRKKMRLMHEQILTVNNCNTPREPIVQEIPPAKKIKKEPEEPNPTQPERTIKWTFVIPALMATSTQPSNGSAAPLDPLIKRPFLYSGLWSAVESNPQTVEIYQPDIGPMHGRHFRYERNPRVGP
ncbi:uncharacterized protein LOC134209432 [Armigeres subalbatus]|uniref:uncharacterized protein LOC134209432 n=1 Tax=Armigeres subalbatus TaxID=124917 RepID=UPI002ED5173F